MHAGPRLSLWLPSDRQPSHLDDREIALGSLEWLQVSTLPPAYNVGHKKALFDGGTDAVDNMVLQLGSLHTPHHKYYRPGTNTTGPVV